MFYAESKKDSHAYVYRLPRDEGKKKEMLRVVKNKEGEVFIDFTGKAAGRGAYLCDRPDCVKKLKKARLLNKTFSCEIPDSVYERIEEEFFAKK